MIRRFSLLLALLILLNLLAYPPGFILGDVVVHPTPVRVSASIPSFDLVSPTINYISPINLQQNVPADANIQLDIFDPFSGVNINTIYISINGVIYLSSSPFVTITGIPALYHITVHPISPLLINQVNTVTTSASDIAGNNTQLTITFNSPPGPTSTSSPTPTRTLQPTSIFCPISPTPISSSTQPDLFPPEINFIKPRNNDLIDTTPSATIKISDTGSGVNLNSVRISINEVVLTSVDSNFTATGNSSSYTINVKFKQTLSPNTSYFLTVYASDFDGNPLAKSINLKTSAPFVTKTQIKNNYLPIIILLFIISILIIFLVWLLNSLNNRNRQTLGLVYNSLTLEPLSNIKVQYGSHTLTSNLFGLIADDIPLKENKISINNPDFSFKQPLSPFPYFHLPLAPYKDKSLSYQIHQWLLPKFGTITNASGEIQVGLKLGLVETKFNTLVTARITDSNGHYRFLVPHGLYQLVIFDTNTILKTYDTRHLIGGYTVLNENISIS